MLAEGFWVAIVVGVSAAVVIWVLAVRAAYRIVSRTSTSLMTRLLAVVWPFGVRQSADVSAETAASFNKMLVAFFIAILVAIASVAVYSNLTFVPPARMQ
ncbi:hypothetical protein [Ancylobacter pratisalsi]|uniref:Uncharacterized protein n=1 Tax=Ancylobacter pratisalsi TaxID=1745854 RepID=A0A6P1YS69_9HYPH|nr:hypothetical protein [Ancylobacter pratisalsi]QIB35710.1 hypothetical protein G3A50_19850 [Ancylobacter pratisalsi]